MNTFDEQIKQQLRVVIATVFALGLKTQNYHWNVDGPHFYSIHIMLGDMYKDIFDSVDDFAERLRALGVYAPGGLTRYAALTVIEDADIQHIDAVGMTQQLNRDNETTLLVMRELARLAESAHLDGLLNFVSDRIDTHEKHAWFLRAIGGHQ